MIWVVKKFEDPATRFEIYRNIATLEQRLGHISQAQAYWRRAEQIAITEDDDHLRIQSWIGLHNTTWQTDPAQSQEQYLVPARKLAEKQAVELLPTILYEIGFNNRQKEDIPQAIEFYQQALLACQKHTPDDHTRLATIHNDLGFVQALSGNYSEGLSHVTAARDLRQKVYDAVRAQVQHISGQLDNNSDDEELKRAEDREQAREMRLAEQLGMTYATEGRIARYGANLDLALYNYRRAMGLFKKVNNLRWQALVNYRLGETLRRMAKDAHNRGNIAQRDQLIAEASEHVEQGVYLCEKYNFDITDTAYRRMGRLLHDRALWQIEIVQETGEGLQGAKGLLNDAKAYFDLGFEFAEQTGDLREQLECKTEIVFLQDDWMELLGTAHDPSEHRC